MVRVKRSTGSSRLTAAVHQGLLCEPELGKVRLEEGDASPGPDGTGNRARHGQSTSTQMINTAIGVLWFAG